MPEIRIRKGGVGSGHHRHVGRPGKRGGSLPAGDVQATQLPPAEIVSSAPQTAPLYYPDQHGPNFYDNEEMRRFVRGYIEEHPDVTEVGLGEFTRGFIAPDGTLFQINRGVSHANIQMGAIREAGVKYNDIISKYGEYPWYGAFYVREFQKMGWASYLQMFRDSINVRAHTPIPRPVRERIEDLYFLLPEPREITMDINRFDVMQDGSVPSDLATQFMRDLDEIKRLTKIILKQRKGGAGSGHHGHVGRLGEVGGSAPAGTAPHLLEGSQLKPGDVREYPDWFGDKFYVWDQEKSERNLKLMQDTYGAMHASDLNDAHYESVWLMPDGQITETLGIHLDANGLLGASSPEMYANGYVRLSRTRPSGPQILIANFDKQAITPTTRLAIRDAYWAMISKARRQSGPKTLELITDIFTEDGTREFTEGEDAFRRIAGWRIDKSLKGGRGSGHHGHSGRPGEQGGSLPEGEGRTAPKFTNVQQELVDDFLDVMSSADETEQIEKYGQYYDTYITIQDAMENRNVADDLIWRLSVQLVDMAGGAGYDQEGAGALATARAGERAARKIEEALRGIKGGPGSGHAGHVGRPGEVGGSQPAGAVKWTEYKRSTSERERWELSDELLDEIDDEWLTEGMELRREDPEASSRRFGKRGHGPYERFDIARTAINTYKYGHDDLIIKRNKLGELVGVASTRDEGELLYLEWLATREKGHGMSMMLDIMKRAVERDLGMRGSPTREALSFYEDLADAVGADLEKSGYMLWEIDRDDLKLMVEPFMELKVLGIDPDKYEPDDGVFFVVLDEEKDTAQEILYEGIYALIDKVWSVFKGGPGSGHAGHAGRPGLRGGSLPAGEVSTFEPTYMKPYSNRPKFKSPRNAKAATTRPEPDFQETTKSFEKQVKKILKEYNIPADHLAGLGFDDDPPDGYVLESDDGNTWLRLNTGQHVAGNYSNMSLLASFPRFTHPTTMLHEIAHHVDNLYDISSTGEWFDGFDHFVEETIGLDSIQIGEEFGLRAYSRTNTREFFADVYMMMMSGNPNEKQLSNLVLAIGKDAYAQLTDLMEEASDV